MPLSISLSPIFERLLAGLIIAAPMVIIACVVLARAEAKGGHDG